MYSDLSYYYNWNLDKFVAVKMLDDYNIYYNDLWNHIQTNKPVIMDEENSMFKTPLINNEDGVYFNVLKIDFQRAFTNYIKKVLSKEQLAVIQTFFEKASRLYLPTSAKKFLYNYTLTNIIVNFIGKHKLAELRRTVYEDVLYLCCQLGDILKTEVDGAYVVTPLKELPIFDVYGQLTIKRYKWIIWNNPIMIGLNENKSIPTIKGLGKNSPNIFYKTLENIVACKVNTERDQCIEDFLYSPKIHILDWCFKTDDGDKIELLLKSSDVSIPSNTNEDIEDLSELQNSLDRDKYFQTLENTLMVIYELIG